MRQLAYIVPTIYLIVVFVIFQTITLGSGRSDSGDWATRSAFVLTLPWSLLGLVETGRFVFLPMVVGAPLNAAILYFALGRAGKK